MLLAGVLAAATAATAAVAAGGVRRAAPPNAGSAGAPDGAALFERQVRPILERRCLSCHGEKAQLSGLRLDSRQGLLEGGRRGAAVTPGRPEQSRLLAAVAHQGEPRMPPAGRLPDAEIAARTAWVKLGAPWPRAAGPVSAGELWSLRPVRMPAPPAVKNRAWVRNPIDAFVLSALERRGWAPSPEADRRTLIRRVSLDLTGLPPTPAEADAFLADRSPGAWERLVDRLLASKHYGERMAQHWLDLARYADSDGYHDDTDRTMWAYRDYVIDSFNRNKPFDRFTREQIAGDLLPGAPREALIGSAFHRLGPTSSEGGAIEEEYRAKYAVDRVTTTATVWLGLTMQCAECHDHKYDPLTMRDFYRLFAYFNQVPEQVLYRGADAPPTILTPLPGQAEKLEELDRGLQALEEEVKACLSGSEAAATAQKRLEAARKERAEFDRKIPRLRVMAEVSPRRPTHILLRGDYRRPGEPVEPGIPAAIAPALTAGSDPPRLALAKWLTDPRQPLTARVTVNRLWALLWGQGLVRTVDDFGSRGEAPSHPELLDWLAGAFVRSGWDVKHLLRLIATSATYRQSSRVTPELLARDPQNRLLTRGARFRLPAEFIRDNALAISGLLDRDRAPGGPSVKPYQPGDLWRELASGDQEAKSYVQDHGPDLYRRGLYTWWKRSILYPSFAVFDAPKRETCTAQRLTTNTPLQAFVTLNDPTFVEAARVFGHRMAAEGGSTLTSRLDYGVRLALARPAAAEEIRVLSRVYRRALARCLLDPAAAARLASTGEAPRAPGDPVQQAAWTCVGNTILNMDETITRE